jgi:hypothetical protein
MAGDNDQSDDGVFAPLDPVTPEEQPWLDQMAADFRAAFAHPGPPRRGGTAGARGA